MEEFFASIADGKFDSWLDEIQRHINTRRRILDDERCLELRAGDRIVLSGVERPRWMHGKRGTVTGFRKGRVEAVLDNGQSVTCPGNLVTKL